MKKLGFLSTVFTIAGVVVSGIGTVLGHFNQKNEIAKQVNEALKSAKNIEE